MRLGLQQNRYTALTSMNVQTRLWFSSAAVASVKFLLCCSCSGATIEDLFAYKDYKHHCLENYIKLSMKIKLL